MLDEEKIRNVKRFGFGLASVLMLLIAFGAGVASQANKKVVTETPKQVKKEEDSFSQKTVKDFLIAFYTKKDLGENRQRYKPFMTEGLYKEQMKLEDDPVNLAYKGYVVNYAFKEATIYLDSVHHIALAHVRYSNDLLAKKGHYDKVQSGVYNDVTLRLTYVQSGNTFLVDRMETITIDTKETSDYPDYGTLTSSSEETIDSSEQSSSTSSSDDNTKEEETKDGQESN